VKEDTQLGESNDGYSSVMNLSKLYFHWSNLPYEQMV